MAAHEVAPARVAGRVHHVVALALPDVVAFDLSIAAQIFGYRDERERYRFSVCAEEPGEVPTTTAFTSPPRTVLMRWIRLTRSSFPASTPSRIRRRSRWLRSARPPRGVRGSPRCASGRSRAGLTAGIDLCLHMVHNDHGAAAAAEVARRMVVPFHRPGGQAQFSRHPLPQDNGLAPTYEWAVSEMHRDLTVGRLASHAGMSARTFARRFRDETGMSPMRWVAVQRLLEAQRLLEVTDLSIDDVAERCGLRTAANLRLHMGRHCGTTPTAYRTAHRFTR